MNHRTRNRALPSGPTLLAGLLALVAAAGCSSDDFSAVGSKLPTDVSQDPDSLGVALPPVYPTLAEVVTPVDTLSAAERPALYIGERPEGGWRATPLLRFDTDFTEISDKLPNGWTDVARVELRLNPMAQSDSVAVVRDVRVHELAAPLDASALLADDVTTLLAAEIGSATWQKSGRAEVELDLATVQSWFAAGSHDGIAIVHEAPAAPDSVYSNFRGLAGVEFGSRSRLSIDADNPVIKPALAFVMMGGLEDMNFEIEAELSYTHIERDPPQPQDLQIGSWFERRIWLEFDLGPTLVPVDATINSGFLTLHLKPDPTMQVRPFSGSGSTVFIGGQQVKAWEAARSEAGDVAGVTQAWGRVNRELIGSAETFNPDPGTKTLDEVVELTLDVTEYVQRQVNQVAPDDLPGGATIEDVGMLLGFTAEQTDLCLSVFYGLDQPDELKPRLDITYTPPADAWK